MESGHELMFSCIAGIHLFPSVQCVQLDSENTTDKNYTNHDVSPKGIHKLKHK